MLVRSAPFSTAGDVASAYSARWGCELVPCRADIDGDCMLTMFDFLHFINLFLTRDPIADFNGDGSFTVVDFQIFQNEFDAGCV
jgi:hypothetical protein